MPMPKGLTQEQQQALARHRSRWLEMLASEQAVDRQAAEDGVNQAYRAADLAPPGRIVWCGGPREMADRWRQECVPSTAKRSAKGPVGAGHSVRHVVIDTMFSKTVAAVERACGRSLRQAVAEGMRLGRPGPLGAAVVAATLQAIDEPVTRPLLRLRWWGGRRGAKSYFSRPTFRDSGYSPHELGWLGAYQFLHDDCGITEATQPLSGLWQVAANVGWIVPHENVCWLSERHYALKTDTNNERLHCATGPALAYRDGLTLHMWKGVQIPGTLVESPSRITARSIDRELDPVVRRCMIDIITPERYIAMGSAVRISQDDTGTLWRKLWWGFDAWAAVEVINGTPEPDGTRKHYFLQVPPTVRTAREAVAWTYGLSEHQYAQLKLRT
jgi:hypothetical protein